MASKKIIISIIALFVVSSAYLFYVDARDSNPNSGNDWWVVYFNSAKNRSLDFTIENHSDKGNFHWEASGDKNKLAEGDVVISKGEQRNINPPISVSMDKKITILVSDGKETKEIYKNF